MPNGWSAVGGQTQSAYVRGGIDPNDSHDGHSVSLYSFWNKKLLKRSQLPKNPSGSSTGSAVGVSAGYAPFSIGTETDGSLTIPSGRAALYTIKPTIGLVSSSGILPISTKFDSAGPMTKSSYDLAALLDVITARDPSESYTKNLTKSWSDISVAVLDPEIWKFPESYVKPADDAEAQIVSNPFLSG